MRSFLVVLFVGLVGLVGCVSPSPSAKGRPLEPLTVATTPPPPVSGGSLLVSHDGDFALASDLDRDAVWVVDLQHGSLVTGVAFRAGEHPWRMVEDADGNFHVTLRDAGQVAEIDRGSWTVGFRRDVCPAPRGLDYDPSRDAIVVACDTGELVTLPAGGGDPLQTLHLGRDLRDVVVSGHTILVSRFRNADVLDVNAATGAVDHVIALPGMGPDTPTVAWRMIPAPGGRAVVVHQRAQQDGQVIISQPGGYGSGGGDSGFGPSGGSVGGIGAEPPGFGGSCGGIVKAAVSLIDASSGSVLESNDVADSVLPVDVAITRDQRLAIASAGAINADAAFGGGPAVTTSSMAQMLLSAPALSAPSDGFVETGCDPGQAAETFHDSREVIAVAVDPSGRTIVQSREPWEVVIDDPSAGSIHIPLPGPSDKDTGHDLFHQDAGGGIACASCHAEGEEDGHTWNFETLGPRRTMNLSGGIRGTAPFHWTGDMTDFHMLVNQVFVKRMGGPELPARYADRLEGWIDTIPARPKAVPADMGAVARGRALFEDPTVNCTSCHNGSRMSNNTTVNVGTGLDLQVPSLVGIGDRAPYMHDGCAKTLMDRFTNPACGGGDWHGHTSQLSSAQVGDLVAYLKTL